MENVKDILKILGAIALAVLAYFAAVAFLLIGEAEGLPL